MPHPYYLKNQNKFAKQMDGFLSRIAPELEADTGVPYPQILQECRDCYESRMLSCFPYIGGDKSSGTRNLTGAYMFVAMGEVCRSRYGMSLERWGYLTTLAYRRFYEKIPRCFRKIPKHLLKHSGLVIRMLQKKDAANAKNAAQNPGSFETRTQDPQEEYPIIYHTTVCPLANFAREQGYLEYMPYLCNLDYVTFEFFDIPFYRENTCAAGDGFCDFKLKKNAPVVPAWPCHAADERDPLK